MGNEQHHSTEYTELTFQNKQHIFHIVPDNFPLPEDGIKGFPFLDSYSFNISNNHLSLDDCRYEIDSRKIFVPANSVRFITFNHPTNNGHCMITDHPNIDDAIFRISEGQVRIPIVNTSNQPKLIDESSIKSKPIKIELQEPRVQYLTTKEMGKRIKLLKECIDLKHVEDSHRYNLEKIIHSYNDIFTLPGDSLPYTNYTTHVINVDNEKPINVKSYRPPECHDEEIRRQSAEC